jgi:hypothetical protein
VRSSLAVFGIIFLPFAIWFVYRDFLRNWPQSLILVAVSVWFLRLAFTKDDDSWISAVDDLGGKADE